MKRKTPTTVHTNTISIRTTRESFVSALLEAIDAAPFEKQVALFDAMKAWKDSRNVDYIVKTQPVARQLLDAIEEGLVDVAIQRDCDKDYALAKCEAACLKFAAAICPK